jgi:class 3 adenylate cyclase/tetratricopeptide (TPR) repeat protein
MGATMECPECHTENPGKRKFCRECGSKLLLICPDCRFQNLPGDKFCGECGHRLLQPKEVPKELSFDEKLDKLQRYLPQGITDKILSQKGKIEGERKQVTVMFCDMEGFTSLVEQAGAEEAYNIMDQVYELLIHKVHDFEGTVNEMTGDGIMALFGAPIALEDAPQRAIRSAFAIHRGMARFNDAIKKIQKDIPPLRMRIGIHSGVVVVGALGNNLRVEFKAVGDTVNLASRIESIAEPGTTCVSDDTFQLTQGFFRFEALGEKQLKGLDKPLGIYHVIAPSTRKTRFDVNAERGLTPFTGRDRELELLLDSLGRAKEGSGQAFSIIGEAGIGKSRFLYEFRKAVANEDITFLEGKCLSYGKGTLYHPISDILKSNFGIEENEKDEDIRKKVRISLEAMNADEISTLPYLLELLAVKDPGIDSSLFSPEEMKDRTIEAIKQMILKGAEIRPLVLAIEDLHWADKATEETLQWILETIPGSRVLIIFTYRPEFVHTWGGRSYHNQITLNRLSNRESLFMVSNLLGTSKLGNELQSLILGKTEGIPFFIEEFVRSLIDLKIINSKDGKILFEKAPESISIPSTIQDMIMARVDALPDAAKKVLQIASAVEREFSHDLIQLLADLPEKTLLSNLAVLKDAELLYERGIYPGSTYIFKHALTREVVYNSILNKRKKKIHGQVGNAVETLHKKDIEKFYAILAEHFILGEDYEKGAEYSELAGRQAMKKSSYSDAIAYAKRSIHCLEMLPQTIANQKKHIDARTSLSNYCMPLNFHYEGMQAVAPIIESAKKINYIERLSRIYVATGSYHMIVEDNHANGFEELDKAKKWSEETGDFLSLWYAHYFIGTAYFEECAFEKSLSFYNVCLDFSKSVDNVTGICFAKGSSAAHGLAFSGKIDLAYKMAKESLELANKSGDIYIQQMAHSSLGSCCFMKGLFEEAETNLLKATKLHTKTQQVSWGPWAYFFLGELYLADNQFDKAITSYSKTIFFLEQQKVRPSWINFSNLRIVQIKAMVGIADVRIESLFEYPQKNRIKCLDGVIQNSTCGILMNSGNQHYAEAEKSINNAIDAHKRNGMYWYLAKDYVTYAELLKRKGDHVNARQKLGKAIDIFKECGAGGWVDRYAKELATL